MNDLGLGTSFDPVSTAPLNAHSFLRSIQLVGECGSPTECAQPATTFQYEGGPLNVQGGARPSTVVGGPAGSPALWDPTTASVFDFNRDGIPDVFQSWSSHLRDESDHGSCAAYGTSVAVDSDGKIICKQIFDQPDIVAASGRPVVGYLNRSPGPASATGPSLLYQCMDSGATPGDPISDPGGSAGPFTSPLQLNKPPPGVAWDAAFLLPQAGVSVGGNWSTGVFMWEPDSFDFYPRPFFAEPIPNPVSSGTCNPQDLTQFAPKWRWRDNWRAPGDSNNDWAIQAGQTAKGANSGTNWYADVDGDGLVDELSPDGESTPQGSILRRALVGFTRRYAYGETANAPTQIPFFDTGAFDVNSTLFYTLVPVQAGLAPAGAHFYYADINGDGLVDLVTVASDSDPAPVVRPGDGHGNFACVEANGDFCQANGPADPNGGLSIVLTFNGPSPMPFKHILSRHHR
jgi:hypothetical protein